MLNNAGGDAGSIRFPISIPARNIDRYPIISLVVAPSTEEREYPFPVLVEQICPFTLHDKLDDSAISTYPHIIHCPLVPANDDGSED